MTKINQIQQAIIALSPGAYQKLMDEYLIKRFNFDNYTPYGSHTGTDKTTPGTPDSYVNCANGKKILIQHGSVGKAFPKVKEDLLDCLNPEKPAYLWSRLSKSFVATHPPIFLPDRPQNLRVFLKMLL